MLADNCCCCHQPGANASQGGSLARWWRKSAVLCTANPVTCTGTLTETSGPMMSCTNCPLRKAKIS
jgi:hypothetical protein